MGGYRRVKAFDPPDFARRQPGLDELTEALNRGWGERDSRVAMLLQEERSALYVRAALDPT